MAAQGQGSAPQPRPRRKSLFSSKASKEAAQQASSSTANPSTSSPAPLPLPTSQHKTEAGPSKPRQQGHRRTGSSLVRVASNSTNRLFGLAKERDDGPPTTSTPLASSPPSSSAPNTQSHTRNRSASVGIDAIPSPPKLDHSPSSASHVETTSSSSGGRPRSSTWRRLRPGSSLGNHTSDMDAIDDVGQITVKGRKLPRSSMLAAFKDSDAIATGGEDVNASSEAARRSSASPQPQQRKGLFARSPSFQPLRPSTNSEASQQREGGGGGGGGAPGLLRRIGSRNRLGEVSRESLNASQDSLASTGAASAVSSTAASLGRRAGNMAERAMPDWLHARSGRQSEGDGGDSASILSVPRHSIEAVASRVVPGANVQATPGGRSRSGSASAARHLAAPDEGYGEGGLPKRLSGWLLNILASDSPPQSAAVATTTTTTAESTKSPPSSLRRQSNTSVASTASASSRAKSSQSTNAPGTGGNVAKPHHHNAGPGFLSNARARAQAAAGAAASTAGLERALRYIHEGGQEEEIWLLGVKHGGRGALVETASANESGVTQRLGPAIEIQEACAPTSPVKERSGDEPSPPSDDDNRPGVRKLTASEETPRSCAEAPTSSAGSPTRPQPSDATSPPTPKSSRHRPAAVSSPGTNSQKGDLLHRVASSNDFQSDFQSRIWCTYRNHFGPIARDGTISKEAEEAAATIAAAASEAAAGNEAASRPASSLSGSVTASAPPATPSGPRNAGSWLTRRLIDATPGIEAASHSSPSLGAALGVSPSTTNTTTTTSSSPPSITPAAPIPAPASSLSEKMGILPNLWGRATAAVQATGLTGRSGLTTDAGWGCMLRTGQSLLANALVEVHLGRGWRRAPLPASPPPVVSSEADQAAYLASRRRQARYVELLSWFMDDPSSSCPFSVHRMAREGKRLGKEVGEWFGPSTAAGAIRKLVDEWPQAGLGVSTATDGVVYLSEVRRAAKAPSSSAGEKRARPVLVLINVRLGLEGVHPTYYDSIRQLFTFPQSVGIAGGRPGSSYYFVGFQGGELLYLDPHHVRGMVPFKHPPPAVASVMREKEQGGAVSQEPEENNESERARTTWYLSAYSDAELSTYHCDRPRRMPVRSLDPSMLLGFLVDIDPDTGDIEPSLSDLASRVKSLPKPIFSLQEAMPRWMRDDDDDDDDEFDEGDGLSTGGGKASQVDDDPSLESFSESSQTDDGDVGTGSERGADEDSTATRGRSAAGQRAADEGDKGGQLDVKTMLTISQGSTDERPSLTSEDTATYTTAASAPSSLQPSRDTETERERPRLSSMASDATARNPSRRGTKRSEASSTTIGPSTMTASRPAAPSSRRDEATPSADSSMTTTTSKSSGSGSSVPFPYAAASEAASPQEQHESPQAIQLPTSPRQRKPISPPTPLRDEAKPFGPRDVEQQSNGQEHGASRASSQEIAEEEDGVFIDPSPSNTSMTQEEGFFNVVPSPDDSPGHPRPVDEPLSSAQGHGGTAAPAVTGSHYQVPPTRPSAASRQDTFSTSWEDVSPASVDAAQRTIPPSAQQSQGSSTRGNEQRVPQSAGGREEAREKAASRAQGEEEGWSPTFGPVE